MADTLRIMFDEDGFPRELLTDEDRERAVAMGSLDAATEVTVYRENRIPAYQRADAVPELRVLLGIAGPTPTPTGPPEDGAPIASVPDGVVAAPIDRLASFDTWIEPSAPRQTTTPVAATETRLWASAPPGRSSPAPAKSAAPNPALQPLHKYADFAGRATRTELLSFALLEFLVLGVAAALSTNAAIIGALVVLIPNLAVQVRRLHDLNITGWAVLLGLIPYVGWLILLILLLLPGTRGPNKYGRNPRV